MRQSVQRSAGAKGLYFLACFFAAPLVGWAIAAAWGTTGVLTAVIIAALPAVLLIGYGIWHARRILRTIRLRLGGARRVDDDPVAERAAPAFRTAGRLVGALMLVVALLAQGVGLALSIGLVAVAAGEFLGRAARDGRLPAPEFE